MPLEKMICGENYTTELLKDNVNRLIERSATNPVIFSAIGDSRMANSFLVSGSSLYSANQGMITWLRYLSGARIELPYNYDLAVSGATTSEIKSQVAGVFLLPVKPTFTLINGGTNDFGGNPTIEGAMLAFENITSAAIELSESGITPIVEVDTPRTAASWSADAQVVSTVYNRMLRKWARGNGVLLADHESAYIQQSGDPQIGYNVADGIHQSCTGALVRAIKVLDVVDSLIQPYTESTGSTIDIYNESLNPSGNIIEGLMRGDGGTNLGDGASGSVSTGFTSRVLSGSGSAIATKESPRSDGKLGDFQVIELSATTAMDYRYSPDAIDASQFQSGSKIQASADIEILELSGVVDELKLWIFEFDGSSVGSTSICMKEVFDSGLNPLPEIPLTTNTGSGILTNTVKGVFKTEVIELGSGITPTQLILRIECSALAGASIKFKIGDIQIRLVD